MNAPKSGGPGPRPAAAPDLSMLEVAVEFENAVDRPRRDRVRILVDRASGRAVGIGGATLHAYDVLDLRAGLLGDDAGEAVVVEDAPLGARVCARLWTDRALEAAPDMLRLTAGRVGRSVETLVLGEGADGWPDRSVILDVDGPGGAGCSLHGRYRIESVRRIRPN